MKRLEGQTILITGASQGIGAACAKLCADNGAYVLITDINEDLGQQLVASMPAQSEFFYCDVKAPGDWASLDKAFAKRNIQLTGLINNAGITGFLETPGPHDPENLDLESWDTVMATNLTGTVLGCKYAIRWMKQDGGSIVNISSRSGVVGIPGAAAYAASKAAVRNHTKTVALYCAQKNYGIRCNSIHPAAIYTAMWDAMLGEGDAREEALKHICSDIPLRRMGEANDVAQAAIYLLSNESRYATGIELNIDGGILAGSAASPA